MPTVLKVLMFCDLFPSASSHLAEVRKGVTEKIRLLNEELALIDTHLEDQKRKQEEVLICPNLLFNAYAVNVKLLTRSATCLHAAEETRR